MASIAILSPLKTVSIASRILSKHVQDVSGPDGRRKTQKEERGAVVFLRCNSGTEVLNALLAEAKITLGTFR